MKSEYQYISKIVIEKCKNNYFRYPNVIGIGTGLKFVKNTPISDRSCIQFYVQEKYFDINIKHKMLPHFVYNRFKNGAVDYSKKIITDVIELKNLKFACKSGNVVDVIGESGTITLIFRNKTFDQSKYFALTCAHVAGDVGDAVPVDTEINSSCCQNGRNFAVTLVNSTHINGYLKYDIALAQITNVCSPQPELEVDGVAKKISKFMPSDEIEISMTLDCAFPFSNTISATVSSNRTSLPIVLDEVLYEVENLFLIDISPEGGDSGGLLFEGHNAVGILVARSDGWGLFQPIGEAFEYLKTISPIPIKCF